MTDKTKSTSSGTKSTPHGTKSTSFTKLQTNALMTKNASKFKMLSMKLKMQFVARNREHQMNKTRSMILGKPGGESKKTKNSKEESKK